MSTRPDVTVVVPTRSAARTLDACLRSIRGQTGVAVELVVVDRDSTDDTLRIAGVLADRVLQTGDERSQQRNAGLAVAAAPVVVFIDADMVLEPGVLGEAVSALADPSVDGVVLPERSFGTGRWARAKALEKLLVDGDPSVEAARAFRTEDVRGVGGFDEQLHAFEDWELADRVHASVGGVVARIASVVWHDEGTLRLRGTIGKKRYYGRCVARWRATPFAALRRRRLDRHDLGLMLRTPVTSLALVVMKLAEYVGFTLGARDARMGR